MVDIFDEVEEDLREERMQQLLKKYGGLLIGACVLIVAAVAGWQAWTWHQAKLDQDAAARYLVAASKAASAGVAGPDRPAAIAAFQAAAAGAPPGYHVLSLLREAALRADRGDLTGASSVWDQIAADGSVDPLLRDLASLTWCLYRIDQGDAALVRTRLLPLSSAGSPWRALAQEQLALLDLRTGQREAAKTTLQKLAADTTAPNGVRARASELLSRVGE